MNCAWQAYIAILPPWIRQAADRCRDSLLETRLRLHSQTELVTLTGSLWQSRCASAEDLGYAINSATKYSPWSAASVAKGYFTAPGGHRIGICGDAVIKDGVISGIRTPTSLCIRVARDFPGIADGTENMNENILLLGSPGTGKTTLLRDIIRKKSNFGDGAVAVVDERGEIFPYSSGSPCFSIGKRTDIMTGCSKTDGIDMVLRTMTPQWIAVDEITAQEDCQALMKAGWCGVKLIATVHAKDRKDLYTKDVYQPLLKTELFHWLITLHENKTWSAERIKVCN